MVHPGGEGLAGEERKGVRGHKEGDKFLLIYSDSILLQNIIFIHLSIKCTRNHLIDKTT